MVIDTRLHATVSFDSIREMGLTADLVEDAVPRLKRHEDAEGLETLASELGGGPLTAIPTRKTKPVNFAEKGGLSFCFE